MKEDKKEITLSMKLDLEEVAEQFNRFKEYGGMIYEIKKGEGYLAITIAKTGPQIGEVSRITTLSFGIDE